MPFSSQLGLDVPSASAATQLSFTLNQAIAVRVLDSTATSEITNLTYNISPSPSGFTTRNSAVVDVATSNETGYSLSMTSDYRIDGTSSDPSAPNYSSTSTASYTTALVPSPASGISVNIPTSITATKNYWNYGTSWNEDLEDALNNTTNYTGGTSANKVIPAHTTSDTIRSDVDVPTDSSKTTINIDVNASEDIPTGTYNNRLVFTAVGNPIPADYTLTYDKNTTDTVSNLPSPDTWSGVASSHTFTIPNTTTMARDGYKLVGWSTSATERQGEGSGPDGLYVAGDTYTVNATSQVYPEHDTGEDTLYAIWEEDVSCLPYTICYQPNGADVQGAMDNQTQVYLNFADGNYHTETITSSTTEFTLYAPNFSRTGYGFAGWNTKVDGTGTNYGPNETLQSNTLTDFGTKGLVLYANWIASAGNIGSWSGCSSLAQGSVTALTDSRSATGNPQTYAVAKLVDNKCWIIENMRYQGGGTSSSSWGTSASASYFNYTNMNRSLTASPTDSNSTGAQWYSYGAYYSWLARTSVCPSGWSVPTASGSSTDFSYLYSLVGNASDFTTSNNLRKYPNNFVFAGYWLRSSAAVRGRSASYRSATQVNSNFAYYLGFYPTNAGPANSNYKYYGFSIRCVRSS